MEQQTGWNRPDQTATQTSCCTRPKVRVVPSLLGGDGLLLRTPALFIKAEVGIGKSRALGAEASAGQAYPMLLTRFVPAGPRVRGALDGEHLTASNWSLVGCSALPPPLHDLGRIGLVLLALASKASKVTFKAESSVHGTSCLPKGADPALLVGFCSHALMSRSTRTSPSPLN